MKIVILGVQNDPTLLACYNRFKNNHDIVAVVKENKEPISVFIKRRIKKLGILKVASQILFKILIIPILKRRSKKRIENLAKNFHFDYSEIPDAKCLQFESVNEAKCIQAIVDCRPDFIIVNGTRILSKTFIQSFSCPIVNTHVGITPMYRGVHGGYWALANQDVAHCGVTVHIIDPGIDTGGILYQATITPTKHDNFLTYPLHQQQAGLELMKLVLSDAEKQKIKAQPNPKGESKLWYHPGIFEYLWIGITKKVW